MIGNVRVLFIGLLLGSFFIGACGGGPSQDDIDNISRTLSEIQADVDVLKSDRIAFLTNVGVLESNIAKLDVEKSTSFETLGQIQAQLSNLESDIKQMSDGLSEVRDNIAAQGLVNKPLPISLDEAERARLASNFSAFWNAKDWNSFYDMFSDLGKTFFDLEDIRKDIIPLREDLCGEIESVVFINHEFMNSEFGGDIFELNYLGRQANGGQATIDMLIRAVDGEWGL